MNQALFVVLEGIDGAGTTTQAGLLARSLRARNVPVAETRQPSDGPVGMLIRQMLRRRIVPPSGSGLPSWRELGLLFAADRLDHLEADVLPRLESGVTVVCDRYDYSSIAYQSAAADSAEAVAWLRELNRYARRPDLTLVLDVSAEQASARRSVRAGPEEIFDDDPFQARLATFYADIDRHFPGDRIQHVAGDLDVPSVAAEVLGAVCSLGGTSR